MSIESALRLSVRSGFTRSSPLIVGVAGKALIPVGTLLGSFALLPRAACSRKDSCAADKAPALANGQFARWFLDPSLWGRYKKYVIAQ